VYTYTSTVLIFAGYLSYLSAQHNKFYCIYLRDIYSQGNSSLFFTCTQQEMAYSITNFAALDAAIHYLPKPNPTKEMALLIADPAARRAALIPVFNYENTVMGLICTCDPTEPAVGEILARTQRAAAYTLSEISPAAAVTAPAPAVSAAPSGIHLKQPAITKCNLSNGNVELFLTSMITQCNGVTFRNDKAKCYFYVNNLTDQSRETLYAVHHPQTDDVWYTTANIIGYLEQFVSKNKGNQALVAIRSVTMTGNKLFIYYNTLIKLIADCNSSADTALPAHIQVRYFVEGLNPHCIPTNLKLAVGSYLTANPLATLTDLYQHSDHLLNTVLGPNYANNQGTNQHTGNDFVNPKRRSGMQPRQQAPKQPRHDTNAHQQRQPRQPSGAYSAKTNGKPLCGRCGHASHVTAKCEALYSQDRQWLTSPPNSGANKGKKPGSQPLALPAPPSRDSSWKTKGKAAAAKTLMVQREASQQPKQQKQPVRLQSIIVDPNASKRSSRRWASLSPISSVEEDVGELGAVGNILSTAGSYPRVSDNQSSYKKAVASPIPRQRFTGHTGIIEVPRVLRRVSFEPQPVASEQPAPFKEPDNFAELLEHQSESPPPSPETCPMSPETPHDVSSNEDQSAPSASLLTVKSLKELTKVDWRKKYEQLRQILDRKLIVKK
jgi:hypothetical protein